MIIHDQENVVLLSQLVEALDNKWAHLGQSEEYLEWQCTGRPIQRAVFCTVLLTGLS